MHLSLSLCRGKYFQFVRYVENTATINSSEFVQHFRKGASYQWNFVRKLKMLLIGITPCNSKTMKRNRRTRTHAVLRSMKAIELLKPWHATKLMDHHLTQMGWRKNSVVVGTRCPCGFKFLYSTTGIDEGYKGLFHSRVYLDKHKIRTLLRFTLFVHVKDWPVGSWARGRHVFISCWISFRARGKKCSPPLAMHALMSVFQAFPESLTSRSFYTSGLDTTKTRTCKCSTKMPPLDFS